MKPWFSPLLILGFLAVATTRAESVFTNPVGTVNISVKGNSDTIVAAPFTSNPDYSGAVASATSGGANLFNIGAAGTPGWTANQFAALYYVRMTSGAKNGMYFTITANTTGQLTVDTAGDDLSGIAANDTFQICKYWTLGTLFPPAASGTAANPLTASADLTEAQRRSQILIPNNSSSSGINQSLSGTYFFTATGGWVSSAAGTPSATDTILWPDSYFVIRQPAMISTDVTWAAAGSVAMSRLAIPLSTLAAGQQDNYVGLARALDVRLADSGLESGFVDSVGLASFQRRDILLLFDNTKAAISKAPAKMLFRYNGTWHQAAAGNPVADNELLLAGSGFVVRKYKQAGSTSAIWANNPSY